VGIPAYNEENTVYELVKNTKTYADEVIVVDDGSTDNTISEAKKAGAIIIQHTQNLGKGAALKSIFHYAITGNFDILVTIDGDGQFLPQEIPTLVESIRENNLDLVIGYRFSDEEMPQYRKLGNKMLDKMTSLASQLPLRDTQSGFRAYSKKAISTIQFNSTGFAADSEILIDATNKKLKIGEEKITVIYNTGFKTSTENPMSHATSVFASLVEQIALKRPLRYLGIPGIIFAIIGVIFTVIVIGTFNETRYFSIPFTLLSLGSLIIGSFLLLVSIVLYSISKTLNQRTDYR